MGYIVRPIRLPDWQSTEGEKREVRKALRRAPKTKPRPITDGAPRQFPDSLLISTYLVNVLYLKNTQVTILSFHREGVYSEVINDKRQA